MSELKRYLGIDYGTKRIGIAVSDPLGIIARGIGVVANSSTALDEIRKYAEEYAVAAVVVGMPYTLKGDEGPAAIAVKAFMERVRSVVSVEVLGWDERHTSSDAHEMLHAMGVKKKKRRVKETIDRMAAALILQSFLDSHGK
ncbi:MAG TPA: Holliday junction resolvase RuvX [Bacteroidota bacterium]|nr:Holliday junction resolvase RuvX [Bacteroidota bacterium]